MKWKVLQGRLMLELTKVHNDWGRYMDQDKNPKLNFSNKGALGCKIRPRSGGITNISSKRGYQGLFIASLMTLVICLLVFCSCTCEIFFS